MNKNLILATSIVKIIATFILKYDYGESHNIKLVEENKASQEDGWTSQKIRTGKNCKSTQLTFESS